MLVFFARIFGYILNFIYDLLKNYGLAIIIFSVLLKIVFLPLTIKQQKSLKKSQKIQGELKVIQEKYKNNPEKLNQEMMALYKRENMSPFSGCLSSIVQIILLLAMFYLVRNPLSYMKKVDSDLINTYKEKITLELGENSVSAAYPEISIVKYINNKIDNNLEEVVESEENKVLEEETEEDLVEDENISELEIDEKLYINMNFLGLDLSNIPRENYNDIKVFVIPVLYIISSFISIRLAQTSIQISKEDKETIKEEDSEKKEENTEQAAEMTAQMTKSMTWMMPVLAVSVSLVAPLGLALYWLVNNILMIIERIVIDKYIVPKEEDKNG